MNDDELSRRLRDELHRRIEPPDTAPEMVHEHLRQLRTMGPVETTRRIGQPRRLLRDLFALAAVLAVCALVGVGVLIRQSGQQDAAGPGPKAGIEAFSRIDANTAWAESGSDLYMTRDGGATWSKGTVPGGKSYGQFTAAMATPQVVVVTPTPSAIVSGQSTEPEPTASATPGSPFLSLFQHLYPHFIDADHGWLVSWELLSGTPTAPMFRLTAWRTTDGGKSWTASEVPGTYKGYGVIQFADASHGWITILRADLDNQGQASAGSEVPSDATTILASSDGGATWSVASTMPAPALATFTSPTEGWGYAETRRTSWPTAVIHTTDGGRTWTTSELPLPAGDEFQGWPEPPRVSGQNVEVRLAAYNTAATGGNVSPGMALSILSIKSSDAGKTWQVAARPMPSAETLDARYLSSNSSILGGPAERPTAIEVVDASGGVSRIQATFDAGQSWRALAVAGLPGTVRQVQWTSPDDAWALMSSSQMTFTLDGGLYATHDAGKTWAPLLGAASWPASTEPSTPNPFASVDAVPSEAVPTPEQSAGTEASPTAAVTGAARASSAAATTTPDTSGLTLAGIDRIDEQTGWALLLDPAGGQAVRITTDGGATWSEPRGTPGETPQQLQFVDATHGWQTVSKTSGTEAVPNLSVTVWRTTDGGRSWRGTGVPVGRPADAQGSLFEETTLHFRDRSNGVLIAEYGWADLMGKPNVSPTPSQAICEAFETSDGGATWSQPVAVPCLTRATFPDGEFGYANDILGRPVLYLTFDGGRTWTTGSLPSGLSSSGSFGLKVVREHPDGTLTAIGDWLGKSGEQAVSLLTSTDRGKTWTLTGTPKGLSVQAQIVPAGGVLLAIEPAASGALAESKVLVSRDGGLSWTPWANTLPFGPAGLDFVGESDGWALLLGRDRSVSATHDGGATWTPILTP